MALDDAPADGEADPHALLGRADPAADHLEQLPLRHAGAVVADLEAPPAIASLADTVTLGGAAERNFSAFAIRFWNTRATPNC